MKTICIFIFAVLSTAVISAQVINVPAEHSSIQAAIDIAVDGDTVLVEEGTFLENINFKGKAITVASRFILNGDTAHITGTIIDGSQPSHPDTASTVLMISGEDTTSVLLGFTIKGGSGSLLEVWIGKFKTTDLTGGGICIANSGGKICHNIIDGNQVLGESDSYYVHGGGVYANVNHNHSAIIRDNIIRNNRSEGITVFGAGVALMGGRVILENNLITNNTLRTSRDPNGTGVNWVNLSSPGVINELIIRNNIISENKGKSSRNAQWGGSVALYNRLEGKQVELYNNIVADNYTSGSGGGLSLFRTDVLFYNNTIINNESRGVGNNIIMGGTSNIVMYNNIVWSDTENNNSDIFSQIYKGYSLHAYHNIIKEPFPHIEEVKAENNSFIGPGYSNRSSFQLSENSPAIGRGAKSLQINGTRYYAPKKDLVGNARPNDIDPYVDLGALESDFCLSFYSNTELVCIKQSGCRLCPCFSNDIMDYEMEVPDNFNKYSEIIGIPKDSHSKLDMNYATDISSENIDERTATITVTSSDGTEKKIYNVVYVPLSTDVKLSNLSISEGELVPVWDPDTCSYEVGLPTGSTETPSITCSTSHDCATYDIRNASNITSSAKSYRSSVVTVISEFGEAYTQKYNILFNVGVVGIEKNLIDSDLKVYPNPFSSNVTLEWKTIKVIDKIEMINMLGQIVRTIDHPLGNKVIIERKNLSSGVYFLRVYSENTSVIKVVIE